MRIAVLGSGGIGGYYGARLANAGEDVVFIARGARTTGTILTVDGGIVAQ